MSTPSKEKLLAILNPLLLHPVKLPGYLLHIRFFPHHHLRYVEGIRDGFPRGGGTAVITPQHFHHAGSHADCPGPPNEPPGVHLGRGDAARGKTYFCKKTRQP